MIASLRGTVLHVAGGAAVIEVAGVGYAVALTTQHALALRIGAEAFVWTAQIVREDELSLYGFPSREELEVFSLLLGVTGVGPKSALGVLSAMTPGQVAAAVVADDDGAFRKVSGIGPKTAKLIVVSLAGKLLGLELTEGPVGARVSSAQAETIAALVGLGFVERRAAEVVAELADEAPDASAAALLRLALSALGPAQRAGALSDGGVR